jgi:hypothetical protein
MRSLETRKREFENPQLYVREYNYEVQSAGGQHKAALLTTQGSFAYP